MLAGVPVLRQPQVLVERHADLRDQQSDILVETARSYRGISQSLPDDHIPQSEPSPWRYPSAASIKEFLLHLRVQQVDVSAHGLHGIMMHHAASPTGAPPAAEHHLRRSATREEQCRAILKDSTSIAAGFGQRFALTASRNKCSSDRVDYHKIVIFVDEKRIKSRRRLNDPRILKHRNRWHLNGVQSPHVDLLLHAGAILNVRLKCVSEEFWPGLRARYNKMVCPLMNALELAMFQKSPPSPAAGIKELGPQRQPNRRRPSSPVASKIADTGQQAKQYALPRRSARMGAPRPSVPADRPAACAQPSGSRTCR